MTLMELMIVMAILGLVLMTLMGIALTTTHLHGKTTRLAAIQMTARDGMSLMETELRQAGADPGDPQIGVVGIVTAQQNLIRIRADLNADRAIQTAEPSEDVTYSYSSVNRAIMRNPGAGAQILVPNVKSMTLTYFDGANAVLGALPLSAADASRVRAVGLTITAQDQDSVAVTLNTRIALRNMQ